MPGGATELKIGIFTDSYRPYTSGVVRSIELFTHEFITSGHEVYIFGPDYPLLQPPREEGVFRFFSLPAPTIPEFALPIPVSFQFGPLIKKLELDLIHVHSPFLLGSLGARAARRLKLPLVFTFHTLYDQYVHYLPFDENTSRRVVQNIGRDFCNRCNLVVAPSMLVANYLQRIGVKAPIEKVPTGLDLSEFSALNPDWLFENYGVSNNNKVLLFVGRLGQEKNVAFLLKSFAVILRRHPQTVLVLVGSGPQEDYLKKMAKQLGLSERVIFTGVLPRSAIVHCYASADLFVFPSVTDTQGLVIGEAKATGLPVVAIRAFGPAEAVIHNEDGLLTDPTLSSFTNAISELLGNAELCRRMSKNALINVQSLSSARCAEIMIAHYQNLLRNKAVAPRRRKPYADPFFTINGDQFTIWGFNFTPAKRDKDKPV